MFEQEDLEAKLSCSGVGVRNGLLRIGPPQPTGPPPIPAQPTQGNGQTQGKQTAAAPPSPQTESQSEAPAQGPSPQGHSHVEAQPAAHGKAKDQSRNPEQGRSRLGQTLGPAQQAQTQDPLPSQVRAADKAALLPASGEPAAKAHALVWGQGLEQPQGSRPHGLAQAEIKGQAQPQTPSQSQGLVQAQVQSLEQQLQQQQQQQQQQKSSANPGHSSAQLEGPKQSNGVTATAEDAGGAPSAASITKGTPVTRASRPCCSQSITTGISTSSSSSSSSPSSSPTSSPLSPAATAPPLSLLSSSSSSSSSSSLAPPTPPVSSCSLSSLSPTSSSSPSSPSSLLSLSSPARGCDDSTSSPAAAAAAAAVMCAALPERHGASWPGPLGGAADGAGGGAGAGGGGMGDGPWDGEEVATGAGHGGRAETHALLDHRVLARLFLYFTIAERRVLAQVCRAWRRALYQPRLWEGVTPVLHCAELYRSLEANGNGEAARTGDKEFVSLLGFAARGFDSFCLVGVSDLDVCEFIDNYPLAKAGVRAMGLRRSTITDAGLEVMLEQMQGLVKLELSGCNDFTEAGLWSSLNGRLQVLGLSDCINVADDALAAIARLLPDLCELSLQAYHVTDVGLAYLTARPGLPKLCCLRLHSCWEVTDRGVATLARGLPALTHLSLSGCSKLTDEGVEMVVACPPAGVAGAAGSGLLALDLSWCPRITDAALEAIACELHRLQELVLDRCVRVTDLGLGYLSTMPSLRSLNLRWCCQIQDFGLQHLYGMRSLRVLSLAGCPLLTMAGLSGLARLASLEELELTNCPGASQELFRYLNQRLPRCVIVE
ncbi:unnamed protein product [Lampetra fluviatilis]